MQKALHLISFDIPYPPNYGGVIDVFYKIKALHQLGIAITLHCFQYEERQPNEMLRSYCVQIYYYPRQKKYQSLPIFHPHIVQSRQHAALLFNLSQDHAPILFEGLHTCYYLSHTALKDRLKLVRMHNIEWDYYKQLAKKERKWWKKIYFHLESHQLWRFEEQLRFADHVLAISPKDTSYLEERYSSVHYLPAFHPNEKLNLQIGKGNYALYHGNLSVNENVEAALFLVNEIFTDAFPYKLIIAGKSPPVSLQQQVQQHPSIQLIANPSDQQMGALIQQAHIHVLPTFQATGIKLKLLYALFNGRFCMVNPLMVAQTGLEEICIIVETAGAWQETIKQLWTNHFTVTHKEKRRVLLQKHFDNEENAKRLVGLL